MRYTVKFQFLPGHKPYKIIWEDGQLKGNRAIVEAVKIYTNYRQQRSFQLSTIGPEVRGDPIENPLYFLALCQEQFHGVRVSGDVPLLSKQEGIV